jgi:hypothetical protein
MFAMNRYFAAIVLCFVLSGAYSQTKSTVIERQKNNYYQNGRKLSPADLKTILLADTVSAPEFKVYNRNKILGTSFLLGGLGAVLIGSIIDLAHTGEQASDLSSGKMNSGHTPSFGWYGPGVAGLAVGIPFMISSKKHLIKSIEFYNTGTGKNANGTNKNQSGGRPEQRRGIILKPF